MLFSLVLQAQPQKQSVKRAQRHEFRAQIFQLEDQWRNAVLHRDAQTLESLMSDDYIGIMSNGMILSKQQTLDHLRNGTLHFSTLQPSDRKVRFYGTTAVVTSKAEVKGTTGDGDISGSFRYTRVYVRDERNNWKVVSFEASRITQNEGGE